MLINNHRFHQIWTKKSSDFVRFWPLIIKCRQVLTTNYQCSSSVDQTPSNFINIWPQIFKVHQMLTKHHQRSSNVDQTSSFFIFIRLNYMFFFKYRLRIEINILTKYHMHAAQSFKKTRTASTSTCRSQELISTIFFASIFPSSISTFPNLFHQYPHNELTLQNSQQ